MQVAAANGSDDDNKVGSLTLASGMFLKPVGNG